jgi:predicted pyridoxine 5'-phosphate oxidase superfamily flavin-nucleotide-binding protein
VLPPSDPVVRAFVAGSMVAHLATVSRAGRPFLTPLWFVADGGTLYLTTGLATRAATNLAHTPDVALLLVGEHLARAGDTLRLRGTATRQGGLPPLRILLRIAAKYYIAPGGLASELANVSRWRLRALYYAQVRGGAGHLRIVPTGAELLRRP